MKKFEENYDYQAQELLDYDFLFEGAYWADTGCPVIPAISHVENESKILPDFYHEHQSKYNILAKVGLKPLGYTPTKECARYDGDLSFLSNVTFMTGEHGLVASFKIPLEVEEVATISFLDLLRNHTAGPFVSEYPEGDDVMCFQVRFVNNRQASYLWTQDEIIPAQSTEPFRAKMRGFNLHILSPVAKDFVFTSDLGHTYTLPQWVPFTRGFVESAKRGISFFFEDKRYSVLRDNFFCFRLESGVAYTSDMVPVLTTEIVDDGYYELSTERFVDLSNSNNLFVGITSKGEKIFSCGRHKNAQNIVTYVEYSRFISASFPYSQLLSLEFKDVQFERHPGSMCVAFSVIKEDAFQVNYYNSGRHFSDYMVEISYVDLKNKLKNKRMKNGHGYSKEKPHDVTTPTIYLLTFAIKKRLFKYYSRNKDTGDVLMVSDEFEVASFYNNLVRQGMYWHNGRYFDLNYTHKFRDLGLPDRFGALWVKDDCEQVNESVVKRYKRIFTLKFENTTSVQDGYYAAYKRCIGSNSVHMRSLFHVNRDVYGRPMIAEDPFLNKEVENIRGGVKKKKHREDDFSREGIVRMGIPFIER